MHPEWRAEGLTLLTPSDRRITERFLLERPAENAYLLAQIKRGALEREDLAGPLVGFWSGGLLRGVCILGSNLLISSPASEAAIDGFAEYTRRLMVPFWVAVGPDAIVQRFLERYGRETRTIRLERGGQMLYEVRTERLIATEPWAPLRVAELEDVESLVKLDRDMVTEEVGFDPFEPVMDSYRQGWLRRVREGRAWVVGPVGGPLIFKVDQSAVSQAAVQLAGIYTVPERRREGLASAGIGEMCRRLLDRHARVTLYVGGSNTPAIKLYEALGFEPIALVRSAWFAM